MSKHLVSPGMHAAMGSLRLTLQATPPSFRIGDRHDPECEVTPPGAVVGCNADCDIVLDGPNEKTARISGFHLLFTPSAFGWLVSDDASTNGSQIRAAGEKKASRLRPGLPARVKDGMVVSLADQASIVVHVIPPKRDRVTEDAKRPLVPAGAMKWITDERLQDLAVLLAQSKRPGAPRAPYTKEWVAEELGCSPSSAQTYKRKLAKLDGVDVISPSRVKFDELADALIKAWPELMDPPATES